jgi:transketolase
VRYNASKPAVDHPAEFEIGKAEVLSEGGDVTLLTYGFLLREAAKAREILEREGVSVRLVNVRTLKPIDERVLLRAARETRLMVTVEDHFLTGGLHSIVAELFLARGVSCRVLPIALEERWFKPALLDDVLAYEGFTGAAIARRVLAEMKS